MNGSKFFSIAFQYRVSVQEKYSTKVNSNLTLAAEILECCNKPSLKYAEM